MYSADLVVKDRMVAFQREALEDDVEGCLGSGAQHRPVS